MGDAKYFVVNGVFNYAVSNGHLEVLKWLASPERGEHQVFCTVYDANDAAGSGHIHNIGMVIILRKRRTSSILH